MAIAPSSPTPQRVQHRPRADDPKLETHATLDRHDREAIQALPHHVRTFDASAYLVREGDSLQHCSVLVSGYAFRQKVTGDGLRQIVSLHIPGEPLDLQHLFLDLADHNVQTLTRAEVAIIPRTALQKLSPVASGNRACTVHQHAGRGIDLSRMGAERRAARCATRLAHFLCEFAARLDAQGLGEGGASDLPMSQEQIGDALRLTAVHVNRTMKHSKRRADRPRQAMDQHSQLDRIAQVRWTFRAAIST
ncbi:Crp/Fnr family transcriptional regulator [Sphingomonas aerolata]|uniref:Crp/Fnr family transcriptional regulator n=1 Tax=Sphingomonas aerolata TaxID=185951 RepID=UPI002FDFBF3B